MGPLDGEPDPARRDPTAGVWALELGRALRAVDLGLLAVTAGGWIGVAAGLDTGGLALAATAGWLALQRSRAGRWLRSVRRIEWARARALVATARARADHQRGMPSALTRAGDAYEREGRMRRALRARGAAPSRTVGWLRPLAEQLARWL